MALKTPGPHTARQTPGRTEDPADHHRVVMNDPRWLDPGHPDPTTDVGRRRCAGLDQSLEHAGRGHPHGDLAGRHLVEGLLGRDPAVRGDLAGLEDGDGIGRQVGNEEPRREAPGHERRRRPVGNRHELVDAGETDPDFLLDLADRGTMDGQRAIRREVVAKRASGGGGDLIARDIGVLGVDPAAREHVEAWPERHRRRSMDEENLRAVGTRPEEHDRCRRNGLGHAAVRERTRRPSSSRWAAKSSGSSNIQSWSMRP